VFALREGTDVLDQHVQLAQLGFVIAARQARSRERTGAAETNLVAVVGDRTIQVAVHVAMIQNFTIVHASS
jgi:hypothetical protein